MYHTPIHHKSTGFTAIEMLLTMGLMSITASLVIPTVRQYEMYTDIETATEHLTQAIRMAETLSQSGKFDMPWGVYATEGVLFAGESYALRSDGHDTVFPLPRTIAVEWMTELSFARITGLPRNPGVLCIESTTVSAHRLLTIDAYGGLSPGPIADGLCTTTSHLQTGSTNISSSKRSSSSSQSSAGSASSSSASSAPAAGSSSAASGPTGIASAGISSDSNPPPSSPGPSTTSSSTPPPPSGMGGIPGGSAGGTSSSASSLSSSSFSSSSSQDNGAVPCDVRFVSDQEKGTLTTVGTNDVTLTVLDSAGSYGEGGPHLAVRLAFSIDDGVIWRAVNGDQPIREGNEALIPNVPEGTPIILKVQGRYSWLFNKVSRSDDDDGHTIMLRDGDRLPPYPAFQNKLMMPSALRPYTSDTGRVTIGEKSLLLLTELSTLDQDASVFRDAIVLVTFREKAGSCTDGIKPAMRIVFDRIENMGTGNAAAATFVGPDALSFSANQEIPLVDDDGQAIIDGGMVTDVPGLAVERGNGWIRIVSFGSHASSSGKEVVDATIELDNATITDVQNDTGPFASESPEDGLWDDTTSGDEFTPASDNRSVLLRTRVISDNDGVYIRWSPSAIASVVTDTTHAAAPENDPATTDPCAVAWTLGDNGMITPAETTNVTVRMISTEARMGNDDGPAINLRGEVTTDGGNHWMSLWDNRILLGNETTMLSDLTPDSRIGLTFTGRYSWTFNRTVGPADLGRAMRIVRPGESVEELRMAFLRGTLRSALRNFVRSDGTLLLGTRDIAVLVDMGDDAERTYQDTVAVMTIEKSRHTGQCVSDVLSAATASSSSSSSAPSIVDTDHDGVSDSIDLCAGTAIPEPVPSSTLLFDRFALTEAASDGTPAAFRVGPGRSISDYTVADTRGCSCNQILGSIRSPSTTNLAEEPVIYEQLKNLFPFYVDASRKFGCARALLRIVVGR